MLARLAAQERRRAPDDADLLVRARRLCTRYLDGRVEPASVRWVDNQQRRWGSCTPARGTVRLSARLRGMPDWVVDYVLLHELAHLLVPGHGPDFWALVGRYPKTERARGFLEGVTAAARLDVGGGDPGAGVDADPDADPKADPKADPDADTGTDPDAGTGADPDTGEVAAAAECGGAAGDQDAVA